MRFAIYAGVAAYVLSIPWRRVGENSPTAGVIAHDLAGTIFLLAPVALAAGLWRFGSVPASTGAARSARLSFMCFALWWLVLLHPLFLIFMPTFSGRMMSITAVLWPFALVAIGGACLGLLVRALGAALRSLGEPPPVWARRALGVWVAWWILSTVPLLADLLAFAHGSRDTFRIVDRIVWMIPRPAPSLEVVLGPASHCAIALVLAAVMGRTARALARQESPETALR